MAYVLAMNIFVSHITACTFWRTASAEQVAHALPTQAMPSHDSTRDPNEARLLAEGSCFQDRPLHVVLPEGNAPRSTASVRFHESRLLKSSLFRSYAQNIFISSPELTFIQMASVLSLDELVCFGNELCSTYVRDEYSPKGFTDRPPVTSKKELTRFVTKLGPSDGKKNASRAIRYISDGTASPAESELAAHLALSKMLGGAGFSSFECNKGFVVPGNLRHLSNQLAVTPDICWPGKKVAIEYDSNDFHTGAERITRDSTRRNTLIALGFTVLSITRGQTRNAHTQLMEDQKISRALGIRWRTSDPYYEAKMNQSWQRLEKWTLTKPETFAEMLENRKLPP